MPRPDEPREPDPPFYVWKQQSKEDQPDMQNVPTPDELCAMARSREKLNAGIRVTFVIAMAGLAAALLHNVYKVDQPWIRLGQAWTLGVVVYLFGPMLERARARVGASEPCALFLERQHEERRSGYLRIRNRLFLFLPGMAASWWGHGSAAAAKAWELSPSSGLFHFLGGPWPFVLAVAALALVWLALGKAADSAAREREQIHRSIG